MDKENTSNSPADPLEEYLPPDIFEFYQKASAKELAKVLHLGYVMREYAKTYEYKEESDIVVSKLNKLLQSQHMETLSAIISNNKVKTAPVRGIIGENYVMDILKPHFQSEYTRKDAKSADILVCNHIFVEVKHYSKSVPTTEVEKFRRDLNAKAASGGVFISLTSSISRKKSFEYVREVVRGNMIPVIYLSTNVPDVIILAVEIITNLTKSKCINVNMVEENLNTLLDGVSALSMTRANLHQLTADLHKNLTAINTQILETELNLKDAVNKIASQITDEVEVPSIDLDNIITKYPVLYEKEFKHLANLILEPPLKLAKQTITGSNNHGFKFLKTKMQIFINITSLSSAIIENFDLKTMIMKDSQIWIDVKPNLVTTIERLVELFNKH